MVLHHFRMATGDEEESAEKNKAKAKHKEKIRMYTRPGIGMDDVDARRSGSIICWLSVL